MGYKTRHVFLCDDLIHGGKSHALSEVLIDGQWLGVDLYFKDVKFYNGEKLYSIKEALKNRKLVSLNKQFDKNFYVIYGLYSKSGRLYRPKILWPDVNVREFLYNFAP